MTVDRAPALDSAPVVAQVVRSGFVESVHHGVVVAVAADGTRLIERGPITAPILPRSANKPLQAVAMLRHGHGHGLDLDGELLAVACASHNGEPFHLDGVRRILAAAGLTEADLQNTPDRPLHDAERERWIAEHRPATRLAQNCSGKHAAMLATCVAAGWDTATYRDPDHPLQQAIAEAIADLSGEPVAATGVDGCGAPVMAVSPLGLARAFGRLAAAGPGSAEGRVAGALRAHPQWLGGTGRDVTTLIQQVTGLIAKDGAEAVFAVGMADGTGLVVKIADGAGRACPVVTAAALRALGVGNEVVDGLGTRAVLGHGRPVGGVHPVGF